MNSGRICILLSGFLIPMLTCCSSFYSRGYVQPSTGYEEQGVFDKDAFMAYLDTAAIDDWEGIWLLLGPEQHCYLAIERIVNYSHGAIYTHRLRLWQPHYMGGIYRLEPGVVVGYLEQGLQYDVKRISLYEGFFFSRKKYNSAVQLDDSYLFMLFDGYSRRKADAWQVGMKRIYPIHRQSDDKTHRLRYL